MSDFSNLAEQVADQQIRERVARAQATSRVRRRRRIVSRRAAFRRNPLAD